MSEEPVALHSDQGAARGQDGRSRYVRSTSIRDIASTSQLRKLRSLGDGLPIGSNRPQNPPAAGTLNSPAKRSNVEAVQRCDQALGDYQSACAGLDPVQSRRDGNNHSPVTGSGEGRRNRVGTLGEAEAEP
jgi:hypothetical protein